VGEMGSRASERAGEQGGDADAGEVVIGHGGMANVGGDEDFLFHTAWDDDLAIAEEAGGEAAADVGVIVSVLQLFQGLMAQAEAPAVVIITGAVGDGGGLFRKGKQVLAQLREREGDVHGRAIVDDVEVVLFEIHDLLAVRVPDPCLLDGPLAGDGPVEHWGAGSHLVDGERDFLLESGEGLGDTGAGDAATDRMQLGDQRVDVGAWIDSCGVGGKWVGHGGGADYIPGWARWRI
jgi:hypothetical protein